MKNFESFISEIPTPACPGCELSTYCTVQKHIADNPIIPYTTAAEVEASQIVSGVEAQVNNIELEEGYAAWRDRMQVKLHGDPNGLRDALAAINDLYASTLSLQLSNDISRFDFLEMIRAQEDARHEKESAVDAAVALLDEHGCDGPRVVKIGRFFNTRSVTVCSLGETPEFQKIRELREADDKYLQDMIDRGDIVKRSGSE